MADARGRGRPVLRGSTAQGGRAAIIPRRGELGPIENITKSFQKSGCVPENFSEVRRKTINHQRIMSKENHHAKPGKFCWNELVTSNVPAAKKFYAKLLGWKTQPFGRDAVGYTLFKKGKNNAGGMMKSPKPGCPAQWIPYVIVDDVNATAQKAAKLRGKVVMPPFDVPAVGRIAVLADPQGATIGIIKPTM
jgi:predicted enzyme related to lactoylglutathione lyase